MKKLTLIVYLRQDAANTLSRRISYLIQQDKLPSLEGRDDAALISDSAILVDQTSAHGIFVQLCADLAAGDHPYLIVPMDEAAAAVGTLPDTTKSILEKYGVAFARS